MNFLDVNVKLGLLYYVREADNGEMRVVPVRRHELVHLINRRNEMAAYVSDRNRLPPMIQNSYKCGKCFAKDLCFVYHKARIRLNINLTRHMRYIHESCIKLVCCFELSNV
jgi:hypothetical protein